MDGIFGYSRTSTRRTNKRLRADFGSDRTNCQSWVASPPAATTSCC